MRKARRNGKLFKKASRLYDRLRDVWEKRLHCYDVSLIEKLDWDVDELVEKLDECHAEAEDACDVDTAMLVDEAMQYLSGEWAW